MNDAREKAKATVEKLAKELRGEGIDVEISEIEASLDTYERNRLALALTRLFMNHRLTQSFLAQKAKQLEEAESRETLSDEDELILPLMLLATMVDDILDATGFDSAPLAAEYIRENNKGSLFKDLEAENVEFAMRRIIGE